MSENELIKIKNFFGNKCNVISDFKRREQKEVMGNAEEKILELIKHRPVTYQDISSSLGVHIGEVIKHVDKLEKQNKITSKVYQGDRYFKIPNPSRH